jgi:hypothetical protein
MPNCDLRIGLCQATSRSTKSEAQPVAFQIVGLPNKEDDSIVGRMISPDHDPHWQIYFFRTGQAVNFSEELSNFSSPEQAVEALQAYLNEEDIDILN